MKLNDNDIQIATSEPSAHKYLPNEAAIYSIMEKFFNFTMNNLNQNFDDPFAHPVTAYSSDLDSDPTAGPNDAQFVRYENQNLGIVLKIYFLIGSDMSNLAQAKNDDFYADTFTLGHEFGHYVHWESPMGGKWHMPDLKSSDENHGGYLNSDSSDSFVEGFAHFFGGLMEHEIFKVPISDVKLPVNSDSSQHRLLENIAAPGNVENSFTLSDPLNVISKKSHCGIVYDRYGEEYAVATLLWNYYNHISSQSQTPSIDVFQQIISGNPSNAYQLIKTLENHDKTDVDIWAVQRMMYNDTNNDCQYEQGETIGKSTWQIAASRGVLISSLPGLYKRDVYLYTPNPPNRLFGISDPATNIKIDVTDPGTGQPMTDFDLEISTKYDPPYDIYNVDSTVHADFSPYIFKGEMFHPGTMTITVLKGGIISSTDYTFNDYWDAYLTANVTDALITKSLGSNNFHPITLFINWVNGFNVINHQNLQAIPGNDEICGKSVPGTIVTLKDASSTLNFSPQNVGLTNQWNHWCVSGLHFTLGVHHLTATQGAQSDVLGMTVNTPP